jgi:hypothetical protein
MVGAGGGWGLWGWRGGRRLHRASCGRAVVGLWCRKGGVSMVEPSRQAGLWVRHIVLRSTCRERFGRVAVQPRQRKSSSGWIVVESGSCMMPRDQSRRRTPRSEDAGRGIQRTAGPGSVLALCSLLLGCWLVPITLCYIHADTQCDLGQPHATGHRHRCPLRTPC